MKNPVAGWCLIILFWTALAEGADRPSITQNISPEFVRERNRMIQTQIRSRGITDQRVLAAMGRVERHRFVPQAYRDQAYADHPLPIGQGQTISQPYIVALMTELLELRGEEKVLEIGTGSGYQAAVLAEIVREVWTIEIIPALAEKAGALLAELGYRNVRIRTGDGYRGWPDKAPFDGILVTAAPDHVPQPLLDQLKEGGRMVIPVGRGFQELKKIIKRGGKIETTGVIPVRFVPMTGPGIRP